LLLKPIKSYTNGWVASISFASGVPGGRKPLASVIAMAAVGKPGAKQLLPEKA